MRRNNKLAIAAAITTLAGLSVMTNFANTQEINRASFNKDGSVQQPRGWERWVFVGTPLTPNALNDGEASFQEFHNVYIEPSAFDYWSKSGKFPNGTQIVKARTFLYKADTCDEQTGICSEVSGNGYFQGEYSGLELTVKDTKRFPNEPGGWVYYKFGEKPPWAESAKAFPAEACNACHQGNAADDFVFTQFYPVLRAAKPKK